MNDHSSTYLAELFAKGERVGRNDAEAYYFYGISIILNYGDEELFARRRAIGDRLSANERDKQNARLRKWISELKAQGYPVFGESEFESNEVTN